MDASASSWRAPRFNRNGSSSGSEANSSTIASTRVGVRSVQPQHEPNSSSSRTVLQQIWLSGFWNKKPTRRDSSLVRRSLVGTPSMSTWPASGLSRPFIRRIVVDFPAPFVPTNATNSPSRMVKLTPFRMGADPS